MGPIHLPEVKNNPQSTACVDLIKAVQANGLERWQIWHLPPDLRLG